VLPAVVVVTGVYVAVALAAASLVGASTLVAQRETALAAAGEEIAGLAGKVVVSIAAAFSAASAINATLFATARLSRRIAAEGELPGSFAHENGRGVPDRSVVVLGAAGMALALVGSLGGLVEAASITFLATFAGVNVMAATRLPDGRLPALLGAAGAGAGVIIATVRLATEQPASLLALGVLAIAAFVLRPWLLQHAGR
jgi:amino acid transporter